MPAAKTSRTRGPGQKAGLSRESVLDHALTLVDRVGLAALTMRGLGAELGVEAMTVYHYVPTKDALLDGILERAFTLATPDIDTTRPWQESLHDYAHGLYQGLLRHPGVLPLASSRPAATPDMLDRAEDYLRLLVDAGFALGRALHMVNALTVFVIGHATAAAAVRTAAQGASQEPEADAGSTAWVAGLDADRYPLLVEAARTGQGTDDDERFAFAVDSLITGFADRGPA
ncbi:TetR/AcrR family transcriptional regulator C-terminal domain-containing protein [Catenulispora subtropica]|uniref:TetR/AcrR family transcriptional regulator C-terminal domain-containing protein n=1 Tax=Catenulispora subtropica TaxID=450798 RepID=A0ABP5CDZ1_9ACTN